MAHAKALLLVDDEQANVAEFDVLREDAVRADEHVDLALFKVCDDLFLFLGRAEAREHFDAHRRVGHALGEGLVVLLGEDGRWHQYGDLFVVADGLEGGAHGNFGLAITDVAADEAVHRMRRFHIGFDLFHRAQLVGCFLERECRLQLLLHGAIAGKAKTG